MTWKVPQRGRAILALVRPMAEKMAHLGVDDRITLLCGLLAQEICTLPPGLRDGMLDSVLAELPGILDSTEEGMRKALAENARGDT